MFPEQLGQKECGYYHCTSHRFRKGNNSGLMGSLKQKQQCSIQCIEHHKSQWVHGWPGNPDEFPPDKKYRQSNKEKIGSNYEYDIPDPEEIVVGMVKPDNTLTKPSYQERVQQGYAISQQIEIQEFLRRKQSFGKDDAGKSSHPCDNDPDEIPSRIFLYDLNRIHTIPVIVILLWFNRCNIH
jgi:hypothetical protein